MSELFFLRYNQSGAARQRVQLTVITPGGGYGGV